MIKLFFQSPVHSERRQDEMKVEALGTGEI